MKISTAWMQYLSDHYNIGVKILPDGGIDELVQKIGRQLGAVEAVEDLGQKYRGILVAKVVNCEPHPDADKLKVCLIDDGGKQPSVDRNTDGLVQVVCGAPNVQADMMVAWLPPGVTVPSTIDKEPLVLEAREIRGQISNGMLASAHELALSDDHGGILEIDQDVQHGTDLTEVYNLNDYIIDIENKMFTHRPDCFGMLGVAREIAGITGQQFKSPSIYQQSGSIINDEQTLSVKIDNQLPDLVPRFLVQVFENVTIKPSPLWLQTYLSRVGLRPINNVVDLTNYYMLLTGQPMHAYDYDKVKALSNGEASLVVRYPATGEKIKLLNGKEITPRKEAIMIATDKQLIGIGGVIGGSETEVDNQTKNIILECANFDMYSIRRTSMEHGLFTDAVTRFSKGQSPWQCDRVLAWAQDDIIKMAGAKAGNVYDIKANLTAPRPVKVSAGFVNDRLGTQLQAREMATILSNVEFEVQVDSEQLTVTAPFWRTDIEIAEDIVEEVGRLYGYDRLPIELPVRSAKPAERNPELELKSRVRSILASNGANEVLTYSFVHGDLLAKAGQNIDDAYRLTNAISPDLQHFRISLLPSLLALVQPNIRSGYSEFALFEINRTHSKQNQLTEDNVPEENELVSLVYAADDKTDHPSGAPYYQARKYLENLLSELAINVDFVVMDDKGAVRPFNVGRAALAIEPKSGQTVGVVGEFNQSVLRQFKLPVYSAGFEVDFKALLKQAKPSRQYVATPRFPSVQQDITLKVPVAVGFGQLIKLVNDELEKLKPQHSLLTLMPLDIYQPTDDQQSRHVSLRLKIAAYNRTLKAEEVNDLLDQVAAAAQHQINASRI